MYRIPYLYIDRITLRILVMASFFLSIVGTFRSVQMGKICFFLSHYLYGSSRSDQISHLIMIVGYPNTDSERAIKSAILLYQEIRVSELLRTLIFTNEVNLCSHILSSRGYGTIIMATSRVKLHLPLKFLSLSTPLRKWRKFAMILQEMAQAPKCMGVLRERHFTLWCWQ